MIISMEELEKAHRILSREDVRNVLNIIKEILETAKEITECRDRTIDLLNDCCHKFDITTPISVAVACDRLFSAYGGELKAYKVPTNLVLEHDEITVYSVKNTSRREYAIDLNRAFLEHILELAAYEKQCKALTKMVEKLKEYADNMERLVKLLKSVDEAVRTVGFP